METALAISGCILGVVYCLCGYAVKRLWGACGGTIVGMIVGNAIGMALHSPPLMILCGILLGAAGAFLCWRWPVAGLCATAALTGFFLALLILYCFSGELWLFACIGAFVGAGTAILFPRAVAFVSLAVSGAMLLVLSLFGLITGKYWFAFQPGEAFADGETMVFLLFSVLLIATIGVAVQAGLAHRRRLVDGGAGQPISSEEPAQKAEKKGRAKY